MTSLDHSLYIRDWFCSIYVKRRRAIKRSFPKPLAACLREDGPCSLRATQLLQRTTSTITIINWESSRKQPRIYTSAHTQQTGSASTCRYYISWVSPPYFPAALSLPVFKNHNEVSQWVDPGSNWEFWDNQLRYRANNIYYICIIGTESVDWCRPSVTQLCFHAGRSSLVCGAEDGADGK